jgi:hypothetical protein
MSALKVMKNPFAGDENEQLKNLSQRKKELIATLHTV